MVIRGIERGDKDLRHFTFDDDDYVVRGGVYYYKVNYGKNKLEGEYGEDEINFVECSKVIPLGGKKPKPIPGLQAKKETPTLTPEPNVTPTQETKKRGRKAKTETVDLEIPSSNVAKIQDRFEYIVHQFNYNNVDDLKKKLNELGTEGWEMCGFNPYKTLFGDTHIITVFKRKRG